MKCKECGNQQFFTKREDHKVIGLVCVSCKTLHPIAKKESKVKAPDKIIEDIGENNEL